MCRLQDTRPEGRLVGIVQGAYYVATGVWPIVSMRSFEAVTGPKRDDWLVKTVGALVTVIGSSVALWSAARCQAGDKPIRQARTLGLAAALVLAAIDTVYAVKERISKIYLLDAIAEITVAFAWCKSTD
jgi:hypothetical protein